MDKTFELIIIAMLLAVMAEIYLTSRSKRSNGSVKAPQMLVDTSVLMDGRVKDLAKTGFLMGEVIVPRSVMSELQLLADGADHAKRERARFGMDVVKELKSTLGNSFTLLEDERKTPEGVDNRLLNLAAEMGAHILTLDYNLNKVAQVEGVKVLNINELAKSIRMSHLPGDEVEIELTQKGQDSHQAVGYLSDGTMVVVEQAKKFLGNKKLVEIIRSLQTDAGKMMFAKIVDRQPKPEPARKRVVPKQRSSGRRAEETKSKNNAKSKSNPKPNRSPRQTNRQSNKSRTASQREADLVKLVDNQ